MKKIICIKGNSSTGKTGTILELRNLLIQKGAEVLNKTPGINGGKLTKNINMVLEFNGKLIGLDARADDAKQVKRDIGLINRIKILIKFECEIIFCTSRLKGDPAGTAEAVEKIVEGTQNLYTLNWDKPNTIDISHFSADKTASNRKKAEELFKKYL
jgi:hypothetical protein